jgi:hypothetical protein
MPRILWNAVLLAGVLALVWWQASLFAALTAVVVAAAVSVAFTLLTR